MKALQSQSITKTLLLKTNLTNLFGDICSRPGVNRVVGH